MRRRTLLVAGAAVVLVVASVVAWPHLQRYTGVAPPRQVDEPVRVDSTLAGSYSAVLGIAHNAGNNQTTTRAAIAAGADVVEIDVIMARGQLVAGRPHHWQWLAGLVFRGPTLAQAWQYTSAAPEVKLDLKQSDQAFLDALVAFLREHGGDPGRVLVTSPDVGALSYLQSRLPGVTLLFSANGPDAVRRLRADTRLQGAIGGVSVFQGLVDADLVAWAHARHLLVLGWTVDDAARLDQLVRLGVDGVTTANLAVLRALR